MGTVYRNTMLDHMIVGTTALLLARMMTANALSELGPDLINSQKLYVTFKCKLINET